MDLNHKTIPTTSLIKYAGYDESEPLLDVKQAREYRKKSEGATGR
jgi:hypothetical protein